MNYRITIEFCPEGGVQYYPLLQHNHVADNREVKNCISQQCPGADLNTLDDAKCNQWYFDTDNDIWDDNDLLFFGKYRLMVRRITA